MAKFKKSLDNRQLSLLDLLKEAAEEKAAPREGTFDIDKSFRESISVALKGCPLSRWQVAARMSELTGTDITKSMLDSWTAESKEQHRFPAIYLPAFCDAVGSSEPLKLMGRLVGVFILPGPEALRAEIQRLNEQETKIKQEKRKRIFFLREIEGGEQ
jgi:hypothetical protein